MRSIWSWKHVNSDRGRHLRFGVVSVVAVMSLCAVLAVGCKEKRSQGTSGAEGREFSGNDRGRKRGDTESRTEARKAGRPSGVAWTVTRAQAKGWSGSLGVAESPTMYSADKLYELLDGGADQYIKKGVVRTAYVELGKGQATACRVTLFYLKSAQAAVALMKDEKDPGWKAYQVAEQAFGDKEGLVFRKGRIVGRVEQAGPDHPCPFVDVARRIAADKSVPFSGKTPAR